MVSYEKPPEPDNRFLPAVDHNDMDRWRAQQHEAFQAKLEQRVAKVRARADRRRTERELAGKEKKKRVQIAIETDEQTKARAQRGCLAAEGIELAAYLRQAVKLFAGMREAELPAECLDEVVHAEKFLPQDREWGEMIEAYVQPTAVRELVSMREVLDMMEVPEASRGRAAEICVGRIMRRLGWFRCRVMTDGVREWRYRRLE